MMQLNKIILLFLFFLLMACNNKKQTNDKQVGESDATQAMKPPLTFTPGTDTIIPPTTIPLSAMPAPRVTLVKSAPTSNSQPSIPNAPQGKPHFTTYTTDDGLALDAIICSMKDRNGNLWFGTDGGGVSRYDGKSFTNFTTAQGLANNSVLSISEDKIGNLWFGTNGGGVSRYDGKSFTNFTTAQGIANNMVLSISEDKIGNLWFGTFGGGVSRYDGKSFTNFTTAQGLAHNLVLSINEDKIGNLWFGTNGGGVSRYDGKSFTNFTTAQGLAHNDVRSISEDKIGNLWFGTDGGGVSRYDGKSFTNFTTAQGLANNTVLSISEDKIGNLWFGTDGGVSHYDGHTFTNYTTAQGLGNNGVWSITEDKTGNLWFGTSGGGVSRYDGKSFTNYTTAQGLAHNLVISISEDKIGNLWFGTYGGGVSRYDGKSFTNYTTAQGLAHNLVLSISEDKIGNLWFGTTGGGVSRYDGKSFTNFTTAQGLANNTVISISEDKIGNLWFGTYGGVSRYDGKSFTNFTTAQGLAHNLVLSISEDKIGNLWFGTNGGGVSRYDGHTFTNYTTAQGLGNNVVWSITEDKIGNLWFGTTGGGVSRYDGKSFTNFTTAHGLPDNVITQVVCDRNGKDLVFASNFGVVVGVSFTPKPPYKNTKKTVPFQNNLSNEDLTKYYDLALETFNSNTGYPIKDVNVGKNCLFQDSKGVYWAGTGSDATALVRMDFKALNRNPKRPTPVLYNIKLNEENICYYTIDSRFKVQSSKEDSAVIAQKEIIAYGKVLSQQERDTLMQHFNGVEFDSITRFYPIPQNLVLPYEHNNITFEFNVVQLSRSHLLNFQYMLEGYEKGWSPVLKKREATFGNINEGTYTFKLKAQYTGPDGNNEWSEVLTYTFKVLPPWYRTWWMYTIYALLSIAFVWLIIWLNGRRLRAKAIELTKKVNAATAEIKEQKQHIEKKHKEITDSINYAERIQRSLLASKQLLDENLGDYFVFFKPKDVVSGDFYWAASTGSASQSNFLLCIADSTGHGVPGAIMSILNIACLNEAVKEGYTLPNEILNRTRKEVINVFKRDGSAEGGKDGMDCSLLVFNKEINLLQIAAANNPVWIIRNTEVVEIKPDKMPVGKHDKQDIPFTLHEIPLQKGDVIYALTDGFTDQFGGEKGKKFMTKNLRELLAANAHLPMHEQKQLLETSFTHWKKDLEQVDDVTVVGIRV